MKKLVCLFIVINTVLLGALIYLRCIGFEEKLDREGALVVSGLYNNPPKDFTLSIKGIDQIKVEKVSLIPPGKVRYKLKATGIVVHSRMSFWPLEFTQSGTYSRSDLINELKGQLKRLSPTAIIVEVIPPAGALNDGKDKISGLTRQ